MTELALQFIVSLEGQGWVTRAIEGKKFYTVILTRRLKKKKESGIYLSVLCFTQNQ